MSTTIQVVIIFTVTFCYFCTSLPLVPLQNNDEILLRSEIDTGDNIKNAKETVDLLYKRIVLKRKARHILNMYNRFQVKSQFVDKYPFDTSVHLNVGCTGTLIWDKHVLTSAHCLHNGKTFTTNKKKLKVGLLNKDKTFTWLAVDSFHVPSVWIKNRTKKLLYNDYALITLEQPHGRHWMDFGVSEIKTNEQIQLNGFPNDKKDTLWHSYCSKTQVSPNLLFNYCDATSGISGAGVYIYNKNFQQRVIAVFSAQIKFKNELVNLAIKLTHKAVRRLCKWMNAGHNCNKIRPNTEIKT